MKNLRMQNVLGVAVCFGSLMSVGAQAQKPSDAIVLPTATGTQTEADDASLVRPQTPKRAAYLSHFDCFRHYCSPQSILDQRLS